MKLLALGVLLATLTAGCTNPQKAILRESMDQGTRTIRSQHKDWSSKLVVDPVTGKDHRELLPTLTQNQYDQIMKTHADYENFVTEERKSDAKNTFTGANP